MMKRLLFLAIIVISFASPVMAQDAIGDGFFDNDYILIDTSDCYGLYNSVNAYNGQHMRCLAADVITFRFYGDEFAVWATRGPTGGDIDICIDLNCSVASSYSATGVWGEWVRFYGLSTAFHDVTITVDTGNLYFDALYVAPVPGGGGGSDEIHQFTVEVVIAEATPEVTPEITPEVTPETTPDPTPSYTVVEFGDDNARFEYEMTAGDAINGTLLSVLSMLALVAIAVMLWKR